MTQFSVINNTFSLFLSNFQLQLFIFYLNQLIIFLWFYSKKNLFCNILVLLFRIAIIIEFYLSFNNKNNLFFFKNTILAIILLLYNTISNKIEKKN